MDDYIGFEQLEKRVEWLDNERRNDKTNLASLQNRLTALEVDNISLRKQLKEMELSIAKLANQVSTFDKYDNRIDRVNTDLTKQVRDVNERAEANLNETAKRLRIEIEAAKKSIADIYPFTEQLEPLRQELKTSKVEDSRLARLIEELKVKIQEVERFDEDYCRSLHLLEESRRQEAKRLTDLQGELVSVRKRVEETRSRFDSLSDSFRQLDVRIAELQTFEKDRKEEQSVFIDKVNGILIDKENIFRTWEQRFSEIEKYNQQLNVHMEDLETSRKAVGKALASMDDVTQRFERRINEISEIQRLNDERFRQEWTAFKSDDLKRWTTYMLSEEEKNREINQQLNSASEQLETLNSLTLQAREDLDHLARETVRHVQAILLAYQDSIQNLVPFVDKKANS
jgi:chromosome segregation ATPase